VFIMVDKQTVQTSKVPTEGGQVIDFNAAKQPHVLQRKEGRVQAMRETFKAVREASQPSKAQSAKTAKPRKNGRKKK
jgi:hypothetical protein